MIQDVVEIIETHFTNNWVGEVNYDQTGYTNTADQWLELIIAPVLSENIGFTDCTQEFFELHLMAYAPNKVKAGTLIDSVVTFLQNNTIDGVRVYSWRTQANGVLDTGQYFYKVIFDCNH